MNENFETLFENSKYSQELKKGQIVQADVIDITSDHAILNAGLKSESAVSISQFKDMDGEIEIDKLVLSKSLRGYSLGD